MTEICDFETPRLRAPIGRKESSPVELLDAAIARIERLNPVVNAFVAPCFAREAAAAAERAVMAGAVLGPRHWRRAWRATRSWRARVATWRRRPAPASPDRVSPPLGRRLVTR